MSRVVHATVRLRVKWCRPPRMPSGKIIHWGTRRQTARHEAALENTCRRPGSVTRRLLLRPLCTFRVFLMQVLRVSETASHQRLPQPVRTEENSQTTASCPLFAQNATGLIGIPVCSQSQSPACTPRHGGGHPSSRPLRVGYNESNTASEVDVCVLGPGELAAQPTTEHQTRLVKHSSHQTY